MELVSFYHDGQEGYGAVKDGGIVNLSVEKFQGTSLSNLKAVLEAGSNAINALRAAVEAKSPTIDLSDVTFRIPIHNPSKIFCVGRNYYAYHEVMEDGRPDWPSIFPRFRDSFSAHQEPIVRGSDDGDQLDYEGELVVVIG